MAPTRENDKLRDSAASVVVGVVVVVGVGIGVGQPKSSRPAFVHDSATMDQSAGDESDESYCRIASGIAVGIRNLPKNNPE